MKIFPKTFLYTLTLLALIALLANGLIYTLMPGVYTKQKQQDLTLQTDQLVRQLEAGKREDIVKLMGGFAASTQTNITITIGEDKYALNMWSNSGASDTTITSYVTITTPEDQRDDEVKVIVVDGAAINESINDVIKRGGIIAYSSSSPIIQSQRSFNMEGESGTLSVTMTLAPVEEAGKVMVTLLPVSLLLCVLLAIAFSLIYARTMTRPIKAISDETRHMTKLERDARCQIKSKDEFGELAANVNSLYENLLHTIASLEGELQKVAAAERAKTDFLRAASHELKTPATAVGVIMDNMILGVGKYKNHDEWLPKCKELVDNLSDKLRDILDASRLENITEEDVTKDMEALCTELLEPYLLIARAKGLSLYLDWSGSFTVTAPPQLLGKALSNIFANAVQYTAPGGRFALYCKERSLIVENECEPLPEDQLALLFEPFYRPDTSRSRETGGNGLGLYIVSTILRRLELDYRFEPITSPPGMRFTVSF